MGQILVEIISGVYGYDTGTAVVGKKVGDKPFFLDEEKAQRLFSLGVAKPCTDVNYPNSYIYDVDDESEISDEVVDNENINFEDMTLEELKEFAETYGIKYKIGTKKAVFIDQIKQAMAEIDDNEEEMPAFDAIEAVNNE